MKTRVSLIAGAALLSLIALPAMAGLRAPTENVAIPVGQWLPAGSYDEEIGSVAILSDSNIMRVEDVYACDPLSDYGLLMDTTGKVAELHYVHSEFEQEEEYSWKVNVGAQHLGVPTIEYVAQSYETRTQQTLFQFGADGLLYLCGEPTDIMYPELLEEYDCPFSASAIEIKLRMYPENELVTFQVINRGITNGYNRLYGPYPLIPEIAQEGLDRCIVKARPDSGISYIDGVICQGSSLALPPPNLGRAILTR
jgi:hypothetical protein